jgi:hypothetical protein
MNVILIVRRRFESRSIGPALRGCEGNVCKDTMTEGRQSRFVWLAPSKFACGKALVLAGFRATRYTLTSQLALLQSSSIQAMLNSQELYRILKEFPGDIVRMREVIRRAGQSSQDDRVALAWARYSESVCASWLGLPESDDELTSILLRFLSPAPGSDAVDRYMTTLQPVDGGTEDAEVKLPAALMERLGWMSGDIVVITESSPDMLMLRRVPAVAKE